MGDNLCLQSNIDNLYAILDTVSNLPESSGGSGTYVNREAELISRRISGAYVNENVDIVGDSVFYGCSKLTAIDFPKCTSVGASAFAYCSGLSSIFLPECTTVGEGAFLECASLSSVYLPDCTQLGSSAFSRCSNLISVNMPSLTDIGNGAFRNCDRITSIHFPKCVNIGYSAFQWCTNLSSVDFPECRDIDLSAFADCKFLRSISLPNCEFINGRAFYGCGVGNIDLPLCQKVGYQAFCACTKLESAHLPVCGHISEEAFAGCYSLSSLTLGSTTVCQLSANVMRNTPFGGYSEYYSGTPHVYVPLSLVSLYKSEPCWASYSSYIVSNEPGIVVGKKKATMLFNETDDGSVYMYGCAGNPDISIISSNESIATVSIIDVTSDNIYFTLESKEVEGCATITASAAWDGATFTDSMDVLVYEKLPLPQIVVESISNASYGFTLNNEEYYESTNKGVHSSYAICRISIDAQFDCVIYIDCINYAESNYDYGILSTLDSVLSLSNSSDLENVHRSFKGSSLSEIQTVSYTIPAGKHFIYVKFIKDGSSNDNNDSLQFKVRCEI